MSKTFIFKSEKNWLRVYDALNETAYQFTAYGYKAITVWGEKAINDVRNNCKAKRIAFTEE